MSEAEASGAGAPVAAGEAALRAHVDRFNEGARAGDFSSMLEHLHPEAEMVFLGLPEGDGPPGSPGPLGPLVGREAIAAAYREQPPDDEIVLLLVRGGDDEGAADYAWRRDPTRLAGRIAIRLDGGLISRLDVTFIEGEVGDA